jgi:hypothetical protein
MSKIVTMIKYLILSLVAYYIIVHFLAPKIETPKDSSLDQKQKNESKNNHEDEYVDYEEVD